MTSKRSKSLILFDPKSFDPKESMEVRYDVMYGLTNSKNILTPGDL